MKNEIKANIMAIMEKYPNIEMTPSDIARAMRIEGYFVPYDNDVHIRQLYAQERIGRTKRGVYILRKEYTQFGFNF